MTVWMTTFLALTAVGFWAWLVGSVGLFVGRLFNRKLGYKYGYGFYFLFFLLPAIGLAYHSYAAKMGGI